MRIKKKNLREPPEDTKESGEGSVWAQLPKAEESRESKHRQELLGARKVCRPCKPDKLVSGQRCLRRTAMMTHTVPKQNLYTPKPFKVPSTLCDRWLVRDLTGREKLRLGAEALH